MKKNCYFRIQKNFQLVCFICLVIGASLGSAHGNICADVCEKAKISGVADCDFIYNKQDSPGRNKTNYESCLILMSAVKEYCKQNCETYFLTQKE